MIPNKIKVKRTLLHMISSKKCVRSAQKLIDISGRRELDLKNVLKKGYIGNPSQLVSVRRVTVAEGRAKGTLPVLKAFESVTNTVIITFTEEKES